MNVNDYLIEHQNLDWSTLLSDWAWLLPDEVTVWLMNCYGDLFFVFNDGTVYMLDIGAGALMKVADSRDDFCLKVDTDNNANNWLLIPLVDRLVEAGITLSPGRCYSFIMPPVLGGEFTLENTTTLAIGEHYGVYTSIHQQIRGLPNEAQVILKTKI